MNELFGVYRYLLMTLDPVHIGTGGTRLGRVDNPIVREPGTKLPKIPGTALHGAIRSYAARRYGKPQCAGQGQTDGSRHCGRPTCPICYTFGAITGERSYSGVVAIGDARILLFPVYSMVGPVWVTSPSVLEDAGICSGASVAPDKGKWGGDDSELPADKPINLGWLMVERDGDLPSSINWPDKIPRQVCNRVVLVSDKLFSQIVNSNLEVRTSVSINPETGAAEEGALFTYEAIPRAAILWMEVVVDDYREAFPTREKIINCWNQLKETWEDQIGNLPSSLPTEKQEGINQTVSILREAGFRFLETIPTDDKQKEAFWKRFKEILVGLYQDASCYENLGLSWEEPQEVVAAGLEWAQHLGIGGMGTRGFGRVRKVADWRVG